MPQKSSHHVDNLRSSDKAKLRELVRFTSLDEAGMDKELTAKATDVMKTADEYNSLMSPVRTFVNQTFSTSDSADLSASDKVYVEMFQNMLAFNRFICLFFAVTSERAKNLANLVLMNPSKFHEDRLGVFAALSDYFDAIKKEQFSFTLLDVHSPAAQDYAKGDIAFFYATFSYSAFIALKRLHKYFTSDFQTIGHKIDSLKRVKRFAGVVVYLNEKKLSLQDENSKSIDILDAMSDAAYDIFRLITVNSKSHAKRIEKNSQTKAKNWRETLEKLYSEWTAREMKIAELRSEIDFQLEIAGEL